MTDNPIRDIQTVLNEKGWHQGTYRNPDTGAVCLLGAIGCLGMTDQQTDVCGQAHKAILAVVQEQYPHMRGQALSAFNDHPATTRADIDTVLDKAATAWDEKVQP